MNSISDYQPPAVVDGASNHLAQQVYLVGPHLMDQSLPYDLWTHEAQLAATVYVLMLRPDLDASKSMPEYIHAYDASNRVADIEPRRFHATLTEFYVRAIRYFIDGLPNGAYPGGAYTSLLGSALAMPEFPLHFYSRDWLFSDLAHDEIVEPDRLPLTPQALQAHLWQACA
jgi:hypothetical protein